MPAARAPLWRRAAAGALDGAIGLAACALAALSLVLGLQALGADVSGIDAVLVVSVAVALLALALHVVYHVGFVAGCGQTPGRMALGIAVTRRDGGAAGLRGAAIRVLGGFCSALTLGLVNLVVLLSRGSGGFSDWLAGTRVVRVAR